jgi:hypothetical protein
MAQKESKDIRYYKIWDRAPHNAFTDITFFKGKYYVVFREGARHESNDGAIRVLSSDDAYIFNENNRFDNRKFDLRDPKIINYNDSLLYILYCMADRDNKVICTVLRSSTDGTNWSNETIFTQKNSWWLWSLYNYKGRLISGGYNFFKATFVNIYQFDNIRTRNFTGLRQGFYGNHNPGETTFASSADGDTLFTAIRTKYPFPTAIGYSTGDSTLGKWTWKEQDCIVTGGPRLFYLKNIGLFLVTRDINFRTSVFWVNTKTFETKKVFTLPSGGDNGYPGITVNKNKLVISYYSSHEGPTSIYIATIGLTYLSELVYSDDASLDMNDYGFRIKVFPNPVRDNVKVKIYSQQNAENARLDIYSFTGRIVYSAAAPIVKGVNTVTLSLGHLSAGSYILKLADKDIKGVTQILKL